MTHPPSGSPNQAAGLGRTVVVIAIMLVIALVHAFRIGSYLEGSLFTLYYSYFSDVAIPFGLYFLLCLNEGLGRWLKDWRFKSLLVFAVTSLTEVMQAFGLPILGRTFDPLDFLMFSIGVLLAAFVDRVVLKRMFHFWSTEEP